jgi:hypothetical protein
VWARHRPRQRPRTLCSLGVSKIRDEVAQLVPRSRLHPVITLLAVLVGLSVWGILGGLLAVPVAALSVTLAVLYPSAPLPPEPQAGPTNGNDSALPSGPGLE